MLEKSEFKAVLYQFKHMLQPKENYFVIIEYFKNVKSERKKKFTIATDLSKLGPSSARKALSSDTEKENTEGGEREARGSQFILFTFKNILKVNTFSQS